MAILTKNQLSASNASSFPDNTTGAITPQILRDYNTNIIDSMVDSLNTGSYAILTGSNDFTQQNNFTSISASSFVSASEFVGDGSKITGITASVALPILDEGILQGYATSMNFTGSAINAQVIAGTAVVRVNVEGAGFVSTSSFNEYTASNDSKVNSLISATGSYAISSSVAAVDAAQQAQINSLNVFSASQLTKDATLANVTASLQQQLTNIGSQSGSWVTESETGSFARTNVSNIFSAYQQFNDSIRFDDNSRYIEASGLDLNMAAYNGGRVNILSNDGIVLNPVNARVTITGSVLEVTAPNAIFNTISGSRVSASFFVGDGSGLTNLPAAIPLTSLNAFTASQETKNSTLATYTASVDTKFSTLGTQSGSWITESETGSFARTNVDNNFTANQTFTNITAVSASFQYVQTTYETSSVIYSSGSNQFGDAADDIQTLYGQVRVINALTASGLNYPTADNGEFSFIQTDGNGNLSLQYVNTVNDTVYNATLSTILRGTPLYVSGAQGANPKVYPADASDPLRMPVTYVAGDDITTANTGRGIILGQIDAVNTTGYPEGSEIYVAEGGGWTLNRPSGSNSVVQLLGVVTKEGAGGKGLVLNPGPATLPNIQTGYAWVGNGSNQPVAVATSSLVTTPTDISSLNAFTASQDIKNTTLAGVTSSLQSYTASQNTINTNVGLSASLYETKFATIGTQSGSWGGGSDLTSLNAFTASQEIKNTTLANVTSSLQAFTASQASLNATFATTGSNTFDGNQIISGGVTLSGSLGITYVDGGAEVIQQVTALGNYQTLYDGGLLFQTDGNNDYEQTIHTTLSKGLTVASGSVLNDGVTITGGLTGSLQQGYAWVGNVVGVSVPVPTSSFTATPINTGSFATTGSNVFIGNETFQDAAGNASTLVPTSGSLMLVAKGYTSASAHLSASANSYVNLIFKSNDNTPDTIISGSNNIFFNPSAPTAGFKRYIGGSNNIFNGLGAIPQISGSMQFSPNMTGNIGIGSYIFRGPISSSAWNINSNYNAGTISIGASAVANAEKLTGGLNLSANLIQGTLTITANQSALTGSNTAFLNNSMNGAATLILSSSAAAMSNNIINDAGFTLTNQYYSSSVGLGVVNVNRNTIGGQSNQFILTGGNPTATATSISDNVILGGSNILFVDFANARVSGSSAYHNAVRNTLIGNQLIVSGSGLLSDASSVGSVFVGRYNADDTIRNKSSDVVFAVGTGNTTTRKTGFLIDSGSNTFVEGTLNVSGSTSLTGSLIQSGSNSIAVAPGGASVGTWIQNRVLISGPGSGETPRLYISGSDGAFTEFGRGFITQDTRKTPSLGSSIYQVGPLNTECNNIVSVANDDYSVDVELMMFANTSSIGFSDYDNVSTFSYVPFMKLAPNNGDNPPVEFKRSVDITGSLDLSSTLTASLQQGYVWVGNANGRTTTVATSSFGGGGAAFPYSGTASISGSLQVTGSMSGLPNELTIASNTASIDFTKGNFFSITLPASATTHFAVSNTIKGQTINIQINQPVGASTGSVAFAPNILFAGGNDYQATATGSAIDLLTLVSITGSTVLGTSIKNFL